MKLPMIFGDNMVLQRGKSTPVWGWAEPGEKITVEINGKSASAKTGKDGKWKVNLMNLKAGGPYEMTVRGKETVKIKNVLIGEVWLASGQSNMQFSMNQLLEAEKAIVKTRDPGLRLFAVPLRPALEPMEDLESGAWVECGPGTVRDFSAVAYYFGHELRKGTKLPVGLINSSWGGTIAETWMDRKTLESLKTCEKPLAAADQYRRPDFLSWSKGIRDDWDKAMNREDPGDKGTPLGYAEPGFDDSSWETIKMPAGRPEEKKVEIDGSSWFRRTVDIPRAWAGKELLLGLGRVSWYDKSWFNGTLVGETGKELPDSNNYRRWYRVPAGLVKEGKNSIAVRIFDKFNWGWVYGMWGPDEDCRLSVAGEPGAGTIPLAGDWKYKIEEEFERVWTKIKNPQDLANLGAGLFNAMIHPLAPFGLRGAIWYQGESNVGMQEYTKIMTALIRNWRRVFRNPKLAFLFVQIAGWLQDCKEPGDKSDWAALCESQMKTLKLPGTGMAVATDLGDAEDIHPKNKRDVGRRLARWALAKVYGQRKLVYSGPLYKSMKPEGNKLRLRFDHAGGGLVAKGGKLKHFAVAGKDGKFAWAEAKIEKDTVVVWSDAVPKPVAVRYSWADNPGCTLYNKEGLPASLFRTRW